MKYFYASIKKCLNLCSVFALTFILGNIVLFGQNVDIPDANFKAALIENSDVNTVDDGEISVQEATAYAGEIVVNNKEIKSLKGIEAFTGLTGLYCISNELTAIDVSANIALTKLHCNRNELTSLDVSANTALTELYCNRNQLTAIDVSGNKALTDFNCSENRLTSLDISSNTALIVLGCFSNTLSFLDISSNAALTIVGCSDNQLAALDVSANPDLSMLGCGSNKLTSLDASSNPSLTWLSCEQNQLSSLNLTSNIALTELNCSQNQLTSLDISGNAALTSLNCDVNQLMSLNVKNGNNKQFTFFYAPNNPNLGCIQVDDAGYSRDNWIDGKAFAFDSGVKFSEDCGVTSVDDQNKLSLAQYPNPASNSITIETSSGSGLYRLHSLAGRIVQEGVVLNTAVSIDISSLPSGVYFLSYIDGNIQEIGKFVKE